MALFIVPTLAACLRTAVLFGGTTIGNAGSPLEVPYLHVNDVILFQGDSITDGGRWRSGSDFNHIMGQDYGYIIAAELGAANPRRNLTFLNRGVSGDRVIDLAARWQRDTLDLKPNLLSILIGINDTLAKGDKAESVETFRAIYERLLTHNRLSPS